MRRASVAGLLITGLLMAGAAIRGSAARATPPVPLAPRFTPRLPAALPQFTLPQGALSKGARHRPRVIVGHVLIPLGGGGASCYIASGPCSLHPCVLYAGAAPESAVDIVGSTVTVLPGGRAPTQRSRCRTAQPQTVATTVAEAQLSGRLVGGR